MATTSTQDPRTPETSPLRQAWAVSDVVYPLPPAAVQLGGLLGQRFFASELNRLLRVDEGELLGGFRHRPGKQAWIGEHLGKWLHAATMSCACSGNELLQEKLRRVVSALLETQEADGYLGTYTPKDRFRMVQGNEWDVWVHKYNLIGLLTYYQYSGNQAALEACTRMADLLIHTFGLGKKSIVATSLYAGMASTSVLDPILMLYGITEERRYLTFAEYIVSAWDDPEGSHILSGLLNGDPVYRYGEGKAYEFMSNVIGLIRLYRATGVKDYLTAAHHAWTDIATRRLYITGSGSTWERWRHDHYFPNANKIAGEDINLCETCVTVTWMQLNLELQRTVGGAEFAEQIERTIYNHLLGAQTPSGEQWCIYPPLEGIKVFRSDTNCCLSSGPRGVSLIPTLLYSTSIDRLDVNVFAASTAAICLADGDELRLEQETEYPLDGRIRITITSVRLRRPLTIRLRVPAWTPNVSLRVSGQVCEDAERAAGFVSISRQWKAGDTLAYDIDMAPRLVMGDHGNDGRAAVMYGPLVLAAEAAHNPESAVLSELAIAADSSADLRLQMVAKNGSNGIPRFETAGLLYPRGATEPQQITLSLVPYYAAGSAGSPFVVWMQRPAPPSG